MRFFPYTTEIEIMLSPPYYLFDLKTKLFFFFFLIMSMTVVATTKKHPKNRSDDLLAYSIAKPGEKKSVAVSYNYTSVTQTLL